jgi:hypothetical protein
MGARMLMTAVESNELPAFLQSYEKLNIYIRETLDQLNNTKKGQSFARFVSKVIPISYLGDRFTQVELGQDSRDGGVDLTSVSIDGTTMLYGQAKLTISRVEDLDAIISKFKDYLERTHKQRSVQTTLPDIGALPDSRSARPRGRGRSRSGSLVISDDGTLPEESCFVILTLSNIKNRILPEYERSRMASKDFYTELKSQGRIHVLDGPDVLPLAQSAYRKLHIIPSNVDLELVNGFIKHDNVYLGIISAKMLKECYRKFGDALFLENIRLFLGYSAAKNDREHVNDSIRETAEKNPREMLARNNGITFKASRVIPQGENSLHLDMASIVNGCQTTMCIVQAPNDGACVPVKIVEVDDSWAIAKSANYQNKVDQIALDVARYMRPQALQQAASRVGYAVEDKNDSLYDIFDSVYQERVRYDEAFYLFLGIFSKTPNNVINKNYTELRNELLGQFRDRDPHGEMMFDLLFRLYQASETGRTVAEEKYQTESYRNLFQRFWKEGKPDYRALITILASCGCVRENIYNSNVTLQHLEAFVERVIDVLVNDRDRYVRHYGYAYEAIMTYLRVKNSGKSDKDIQRTMFDDLKTSDFTTLYDQICMISDGREVP